MALRPAEAATPPGEGCLSGGRRVALRGSVVISIDLPKGGGLNGPMDRNTVHLLLHGLALTLSSILFIAPLTRHYKACSSRHHCVALLFAGFIGIAWAVLGLADLSLDPRRSRGAHFWILKSKTLCTGGFASIILVEFASGEVMSSHRRFKEYKKQLAGKGPAGVGS
jgi:hypothetical protein